MGTIKPYGPMFVIMVSETSHALPPEKGMSKDGNDPFLSSAAYMLNAIPHCL